MERVKSKDMDWLSMMSVEFMNQIEETGYKYMGIWKIHKLMKNKMTDKFKLRYFRCMSLVMNSKVNGWYNIEAGCFHSLRTRSDSKDSRIIKMLSKL